MFIFLSSIKVGSLIAMGVMLLAIIALCVIVPAIKRHGNSTDVVKVKSKSSEMYDALVQKQAINLNTVYKALNKKKFHVTKQYEFPFFYRKADGYGMLTPTLLFIDRDDNMFAVAYLLKKRLRISFVNCDRLFDYDIKNITKSNGIQTGMEIELKFQQLDKPNYKISLRSAYKYNVANGEDNLDAKAFSFDTYDYDRINSEIVKVLDSVIELNKKERRIKNR